MISKIIGDLNLIFESIESGPDCHRLDVTLAIDAVVVTAGLAQCLVQSSLQFLKASF
jgi:hypothetical protein